MISLALFLLACVAMIAFFVAACPLPEDHDKNKKKRDYWE